MSKFTDCLGRTFTLRLTLGHKAGLRELGVDTTDFGSAISTVTLATGMDAEKLAAVCHLLTVEPVTLAEYANGFDAETVDAAGEALANAITDFYHGRRPETAAAMKGAVKAKLAEMDRKTAEALTRLNSDTHSPDTSK